MIAYTIHMNGLPIHFYCIQIPHFLFLCYTMVHTFMEYLMVTVYVLKGDSGKRYVGITKDLPRHLQEHSSKQSKGSQVIGHFSVIHTEVFSNYGSARKQEKFLKSGQGRKWLDTLEAKSEPARGG